MQDCGAAKVDAACGSASPRSSRVESRAATSPSAEAKGEIVELSPFTVNTSGDVGYVAENTLAGSRLNTKLRDTASTVSV